MMNDMRTMVQFELKWPLHYRLKFNSAKETQQGGFPSYQKQPHFFGVHFIYIKKTDMSGLDTFPCMGPFLPLGTKFIIAKS